MLSKRCQAQRPVTTSRDNLFVLVPPPAPNYAEAQSAESRKDFIHKMKIALKELRETLIWLKIVERKPLCEPTKMTDITKQCDELIAIFVKSVKTAEENQSHVRSCSIPFLVTSQINNHQSNERACKCLQRSVMG